MPKQRSKKSENGTPEPKRRRGRHGVDAATKDALYRSMTKSDYARLAGISRVQVQEASQVHGAPLGGTSIDLAEVLPWFHAVLATLGKSHMRVERDSEGMTVRWRHSTREAKLVEETRMKTLQRMQAEGSLVDVEAVREAWAIVSQTFRSAIETLQRRCGSVAHELMLEALEQAEREIAEQFGGGEA